MGANRNDIPAVDDARFEADCMALDLRDAKKAQGAEEIEKHLRAAILRHARIARHLRSALTTVARRRGVLSMAYPTNLGGGCGLDHPNPQG